MGIYNESCWVANVSDGSTHVEKWAEGDMSPWQRLIAYCKKNNVYVTNLRMTVDGNTVACPSNAIGYWQSNAMPAVQGIESDAELHVWHGIGYVNNHLVHILWGAMDPVTHRAVFWEETRDAATQGQIIWGRNPGMPIVATSIEVPNVREYTNRIVADINGE